jgi:hypothetical protein
MSTLSTETPSVKSRCLPGLPWINRSTRTSTLALPEDAGARIVGQLQGIGPLGASALVAHLGDMSMTAQPIHSNPPFAAILTGQTGSGQAG